MSLGQVLEAVQQGKVNRGTIVLVAVEDYLKRRGKPHDTRHIAKATGVSKNAVSMWKGQLRDAGIRDWSVKKKDAR